VFLEEGSAWKLLTHFSGPIAEHRHFQIGTKDSTVCSNNYYYYYYYYYYYQPCHQPKGAGASPPKLFLRLHMRTLVPLT